MNKKVVLSVLSTAVVASMATTAFAKPSPGLYIGGSVDKYYSIPAFLANEAAARNEINAAGLNNVLYVDGNAKAATVQEIALANSLNDVLEAATVADFGGNTFVDATTGTTYDPSQDADLGGTPAGELKVESVSAINANTIEVLFNNEVDATKVITSNFTVLNKNSAPAGSVTKAILSSDKKKVTLTLSANLTAADQPYTLFINKNDLAVEENQLAVDLSTTAPVANEVKVDSATQITVDFDKDIADATSGNLGNGINVTVVDLTDSTNTYTIAAATIDANKNLQVQTTQNLVAGHNYKVTVAKDAVVDAFGTKNAALEKTFTVSSNTTKPAVTSVSYVKSKVAGQIDAIVTFNIPVLNAGGNVDVKVQDREGFITSSTLNATVLDSTATEAAQTARVDGLKLANNQILIENVNSASGVTMTAGKEYGLVILANEVKDTTLSQLTNDQTTGVATMNVDIVAPTVSAVELVSATEVKLTLSEAVTYDSTKAITVTGFDTTGAGAEIATTVTVGADGKTVVLRPKNAGELFATDANAANKLNAAAAAFTDAAGNTSAVVTNDALDDATDNAAPVAVKAAYATGANDTITITFTEAVTAVTTNQPNVLVDGVAYGYVTPLVNGKWDAVAGNLVIQAAAGSLGIGNTVAVSANSVEDAATPAKKKNASFTIVAQ